MLSFDAGPRLNSVTQMFLGSFLPLQSAPRDTGLSLCIYRALGIDLLDSSWLSSSHSLPHQVAEGNMGVLGHLSKK